MKVNVDQVQNQKGILTVLIFGPNLEIPTWLGVYLSRGQAQNGVNFKS